MIYRGATTMKNFEIVTGDERSVLDDVFHLSSAKAGRDVDGHVAAELVRRGFLTGSKSESGVVWYELTQEGEDLARMVLK